MRLWRVGALEHSTPETRAPHLASLRRVAQRCACTQVARLYVGAQVTQERYNVLVPADDGRVEWRPAERVRLFQLRAPLDKRLNRGCGRAVLDRLAELPLVGGRAMVVARAARAT